MLEFERIILQKTVPQSNLLVIADGLGLEEIIAQQLDLYLIPEALVFLINYNEMQYDYFVNRFDSIYFSYNTSLTSEKRKGKYKKGGVFMIAQQTLLTDMINGVIDVAYISCLFVINAEKVFENDNTTFIVDCLKKSNKNAIIRGFTDKCIFLNFDTVMRCLQVNKAFMFPRFEQSVKDTLSQEIYYVEKKLKLTKEMEEIQLLILETIKGMIREIKNYDKYNKGLNEIYEDFDISQLPKLNRVINEFVANYGHKSDVRRLSKDLMNYTKLVNLLFNVDFAFFYDILQQLWNEQIHNKEKSTWINLESGLLLMEKAVAYNNSFNNTKVDLQTKTSQNSDSDSKYVTQVGKNNIKNIVDNTKHNSKCLSEEKEKDDNMHKTKKQIDEIKNVKRYKKNDTVETSDENDDSDHILCLYKQNIGKTVMKKIVIVIDLLHKITNPAAIIVQNSTIKEYYTILLQKENIKVVNDKENNKNIYKYVEKNKTISILTHLEYRTSTNTYDNVILTSPCLSTMRKIEVLHAKNKLVKTKVYKIYYKNSLEEQKFLNEVRNETNAFRKVIEKNSRFALNLQNSDNNVLDDYENEMCSIAIDFREMRSALPYFLYKSGYKLQITTLETGDYVLSKNTAIERKAISDFIQSLNSGRLYLQAQMISYKYKNCFLLIEFIKRTCLADFYLNTEKISILDKLVIFMFNFSRIKIIWSNNENLTTKIIRGIQTKDHTNLKCDKQIDPLLLESLLSIPGIDASNYKKIINQYKNLRQIANSDKSTLIDAVGEKNGTQIYNFFNTKQYTN